MGNSGSVHNLHNDGVNSEINSYYTQQYMKRSNGEAKKNNYNTHVQKAPLYKEAGCTTDRPIAAFKVLPQPTESLKLRATTNGAILQAGGTISCRIKDATLDDRLLSADVEPREDPTFLPIRRSHTLILEAHGYGKSQRNSAPPLTEFRRSQTLLHVGYNRTKSEDSCSPKLQDHKSHLTPAMTNVTGTTLKINKYTKKRKAPPAPTAKTTTDGNQTNAATDVKATCLTKPRIYTTNSNKSANTSVQQHQQQQQPLCLRQTSSCSLAPFQRNSNIRNSANALAQAQTKECYLTQLPYRREKSFDAVLLSQKDSSEFHRRSPVQTIQMISGREREREREHTRVAKKNYENTQRQTNDSNSRAKKLIKKTSKNAMHKIPITTKDNVSSDTTLPTSLQREEVKFNNRTLEEKKPPATKIRASSSKYNIDDKQKEKNEERDKKSRVKPTRIPQLKRTFYFGMESTRHDTLPLYCNSSHMLKTLHGMLKQEKQQEPGEDGDGEDLTVLRHNLELEKEIEDNGILVHVRPTLPRRQPETPSFSPAAAWRNLLEEQQRLQQARAKTQNATLHNKFVESPIFLIDKKRDSITTTTTPLTWTPQQDLEDEDEEDINEKHKQNEVKLLAKADLKPEKYSANANSLHIFSLSLPRDINLKGQFKTSLDCLDTSGPGLKPNNCWLVPGFNSLQKFKTTLSGGVNSSRLSSKCTCPNSLTFKRAHNSQTNHVFQTIFGETFATDPYPHVAECELYKSQQSTTSNHNDNWVLHKTNINENSLQTDHKSLAIPYLPANRHSMVYTPSKSLSHVCGGKHVMYLPGQEVCNMLKKESVQPHKTATFKRQRQRQEIARESLQDLTPVQDIQKSNARMPEKNTHRFSFQSTVRVLEKRRLAEKLSKDAEMQEAQRLHELEAMKRVEEDFQRKRAQEKANIRNQLRLHLNSNLDNEDYRSLPLNINDRYENHHQPQQSDTNNNIFCRAEPDGAVSPSPIFNDNPDIVKHYNFPLNSTKTTELRRFDSDFEESEIETQLTDFQRTALLIEPYLQSII